MKHRALAMPDYVAQLVMMPLLRIGLQPLNSDDVITCDLFYEDGSALSLVLLCIAKRRWFLEKPVLLVSIAALDHDTRATAVYYRETMALPRSPTDLKFALRLSAQVKAMAWSLAGTEGRGECVSLPRASRQLS